MSEPIDLTGKQFGRFTVLGLDVERSKRTKRRYWICICSCEAKTIRSVRGDGLGKRSNSCGCLQKERVAQYCKDHYTKQNKYDLSGEYGIGFTYDGRKFIFDLEDYDKIKDKCWHIDKHGYLACRLNDDIPVLLHRVIMKEYLTPDKNVVDHINHDCSDNRKCNLRVCTQRENCMNKSLGKRNTSGFMGVVFDKRREKWVAQITIDRKNIKLGRFDNIDDAVKARKEAENKYFGEYAYDASISSNRTT